MGGGEITAVVADVFLADGKEHVVKVNRVENMVALFADNLEPVVEVGSEASTDLNIGASPELHIGGIPQGSAFAG